MYNPTLKHFYSRSELLIDANIKSVNDNGICTYVVPSPIGSEDEANRS